MPVIPYIPTGQIARKFRQAGLGLKEMLALIEMTWEDNPRESPAGPLQPGFRRSGPLDPAHRSGEPD